MATLARRLAEKEHSVTTAELALRMSALMKFGAWAVDVPFVNLTNRLQEASPEASHSPFSDEETSRATRKEEDFKADVA